MTNTPIEPMFSGWASLNSTLTQCVSGLGPEELGWSMGADRWPLWAVVGHATCQRVFWLCDFAGEPGAEMTRFTNAIWNCPGDDDLENVLSVTELVDSLSATFVIVERALRTWTVDSLSETLSRPEWDDSWVHTRGAVIQRVHDHDFWHAAEVNEILTLHGRSGIDPWS